MNEEDHFLQRALLEHQEREHARKVFMSRPKSRIEKRTGASPAEWFYAALLAVTLAWLCYHR